MALKKFAIWIEVANEWVGQMATQHDTTLTTEGK